MDGLLLVWSLIFIGLKEPLFTYVVVNHKVWNQAIVMLIYIYMMTALKILIDRYWTKKSIFWFLVFGCTPAAVVQSVKWYAKGSPVIMGVVTAAIVYTIILLVQIIRGKTWKSRFRRWQIGMVRILGCVCLMALAGGVFGGIGVNAVKSELPEIVSDSEGNLMEVNRNYLRMWKSEHYENLTERGKMELFQKLVDMECRYFGIEPVTVEQETYDSNTMRGYYSEYGRILSISGKLLQASREDVMETLLHECHHAYAHDLVNYMEISGDGKETNLLMFREAEALKQGFETYVQAEDNYESYYNNSVEVAAREYAREKMKAYMEFVEDIEQ